MITITTDGKRILAKFPYSRENVRAIKTIPGARAHYEKSDVPGGKDIFKEWRFPLTMDTCRMFRKVFGDELEVKPALSNWARTEIEREQALESFREGNDSAALLTRLPTEAPDLLRAMCNRKYQLAGAGFLLQGKQVILGDDPGLGKTIQTLGAIIQSDAKRILVACRRTATRTVWERETMRWAPSIATYVAQGTRREREDVMGSFSDHPVSIQGTRKMLIINIEMIRAKRVVVCPQGLGDDCPAYAVGQCKHKYEATYDWPFLFTQQWDAIILDESHNLLASTANFQSKRITQSRYGAVQLRRALKPNGLAVALSGTPFRSKLTKAWGTLNWLRPDVFSSYWRWAETHFGVEQGQWGKIVANGDKVPEPVDQEAFDKMIRPYYLRRTKKEAAPDLPPILYAGTPIDPAVPDSPCYVQIKMEPAQAKAYKNIVKDGFTDIPGGRLRAVGVLAELTRMRQFANASARIVAKGKILPALPSNKMDWLLEFMQEREDSGRKVVVASSFTEIVKLAYDVLSKEGFQCMTLTGETSDRDRSSLVARFADPNDPAQVVILNTHAGGESITLDAADEMVIIDEPWLSDQEDQLTARIHRVSRIHQVTVYRLASIGTVDIWMASMNDEQRAALVNADPKKLSDMLMEEAEAA